MKRPRKMIRKQFLFDADDQKALLAAARFFGAKTEVETIRRALAYFARSPAEKPL